MYHPTTRVLTVLELLQSRGSISGVELAKRLEVDQRTARRYITMLRDLGIPIEGTRGLAGGYRLQPGFRMPPLMLTDDEALAVLLGLLAVRRHGIPSDSHAIEGALAKIERVLPDSLRTRLQDVQSSIAFLAAPAGTPPQSETVLTLGNAIQRRRRVLMRYRSHREDTERSVDPYGLVLHWNHWYLAGWCHLRQSVRVFRVDRIMSAVVEEAAFERPEAFDSLQFILESLATAPSGVAVEALLKTTMEDARWKIPPGTALLEETGDGVVMRANVERLDRMARWLLVLGCPFVIRQPRELRESLRAVAAEAAALAEA